MNSTKAESRVVDVSAERTTSMFNRPLAAAIMSAPTAPMAPPSVGVAMPRKIVPSTRKISASGGMSTMMTCWASRDIALSFIPLSSTAIA